MTDKLFPGFEERFIEHPKGRFYARIGGAEAAPALVLLHGFPETHASWHQIAPALAQTHRVICLDLKGYGRSCVVASDAAHEEYAKRTMAQEVVDVMTTLGHQRFSVAGHDRGALIAYRIALNWPDKIEKLVLLDNLPVSKVWEMMENNPLATQHWRTFALPVGAPEKRMTQALLENILREHTADGSLKCFADEVLDDFRLSWSSPERVHAFCEDYRAGAWQDVEDDRKDLAAGKTVTASTLVLWGEVFLGRLSESPLASWQSTFIPHAQGVEIAGGHFNAEENPQETLHALQAFLC
jgi:haloacetate dehalogenase